MIARMRLLTAVIVLLCLLQVAEISTHPNKVGEAGEGQNVRLSMPAGTAKNNDDGYDFLSIDQLFLNNPQYAKLLSDLQAHTFGTNWRRKRDVSEEGIVDSSTENSSTSAGETTAEDTGITAPIAEVTEVIKETKEMKVTPPMMDANDANADLQTYPDTQERVATLKASSPTSTTSVSTFGFSGSTEPVRVKTEESTTSTAPIRSSTPRRLVHKTGNRNKLKNGGQIKPGSVSNQNKQEQHSSSLASYSTNRFTTTSPVSSTANVDSIAAANATSMAGSNNKDKVGLAPTKYHYYPHNQHIYFLPECAIQQVCNAVYVRLNYTQPLCACPPRYRDPCSASLNEDDNHTIKLVGNAQRKAITLAKTCENTNELRECNPPRDWSILALQNSRTGKSHYLVICKCPPHFRLEGPLAHDQPTYAGLPGINVYGMLCVPPESYAPKPVKSPSPSSGYNKWKVRPPAPSYRDTEYRSFPNVTTVAADIE
ncbi:uncharacterized protein LOC129776339 [Toxorhynchites rutilus septentrionalis]|uniref:uncharacterized protein LOC129776339 n=1 Tax=Toxorhynchites rutilus septentrionalis TaxID=329112 RepID=UPI00247A9E59|nr:uncharacterized protein LOC129776339 [Toxorhynchites rutilus septentrionalis]